MERQTDDQTKARNPAHDMSFTTYETKMQDWVLGLVKDIHQVSKSLTTNNV